jgi:murein L,D-transpeptidase YcbB/YkuD
LPPQIQVWSVEDAKALLRAILVSGTDGLDPDDYRPDALRAQISAGPGEALNELASTSFRWLAEDMRDGRTPMQQRVQWFVVDPDADLMPTERLMADALAGQDVGGVLARLAPSHIHYARLKDELAVTPVSAAERRALIRVNMDRWRWLPRDLGKQFLIVNVPEFQLRLMVNGKVIRSYKTIVGKPGRTATPQLAEKVEGVLFNPTWTVPQSIVVGEGLGRRLLANPARARAEGYKVARGADGTISVVQQPGPGNALGLMKLHMPNDHAIFLHDTPNRELFNLDNRALSHGCIRVERASELAITLTILRAGMAPEDGVALTRSGVYTLVPLTREMPVYITYFTMGSGIDEAMASFADLYGRDAPVLAGLAAPRQNVRQRVTSEAVEAVEDPGV